MAYGIDQGRRSRVDPVGKNRGGRVPRSIVPVPQMRARYAKDCSPHGYGHRHRRSRRGQR